MTPDQYRKLQTLRSKVTFAVGSWDKYFVRNLSVLAEDAPLSDKQSQSLEFLWYRYRRQIGHKDPKPEGYK